MEVDGDGSGRCVKMSYEGSSWSKLSAESGASTDQVVVLVGKPVPCRIVDRQVESCQARPFGFDLWCDRLPPHRLESAGPAPFVACRNVHLWDDGRRWELEHPAGHRAPEIAE